MVYEKYSANKPDETIKNIFFNILINLETRFMVNNTLRMVQIIATVLGLIESTCIMKEVN